MIAGSGDTAEIAGHARDDRPWKCWPDLDMERQERVNWGQAFLPTVPLK
jgi:hypothetical protein